jgi:thiol-disulfide isomerase/thioredoxin
MTETRFAKVICAGVALLLAAAGASAHTIALGQKGAAGSAAGAKSAGARKQKRRGAPQATAGKSGAGAAAAKKGRPGVVAASALPQVREIDEAGLKALLEGHAKGGRRLLVNFWATWCTPCREEFPDLVKIDQEFAGSADFEFITVSTDEVAEIKTSVPAFLAEMNAAAIPAYLLNAKDPEAAIALIDKGWHGDLPATFLFGTGGEILFLHKGRVKPDELRQAIKDSGKTATSDK